MTVDIENCRVTSSSGEECPKGKEYAVREIERPERIVTSTVRARGLSLKMVPVRTDRPIPKNNIIDAAREIRGIVIEKPVEAGDIIVEDFLGLGVRLVATRGNYRV